MGGLSSLIEDTDITQLCEDEAASEFNLVSYHLKFKNAVDSMEKSLINGCVFVESSRLKFQVMRMLKKFLTH